MDQAAIQRRIRLRAGTEILTGVTLGIGLLLVTMFFISLLFLASVLIYIGSQHDCNEQKLKTWMIVYGSTLLCNTIGTYFSLSSEQSHGCCSFLLTLCYMFSFGWLIIGTVWYYQFDVGYNYAYCDDFLYKLGTGTINGSYSIIGVFVVLQFASYMIR